MKRTGLIGIGFVAAGLLVAASGAGQSATPKGYVIAQLNVRDAEAYKAYAPKVPPVIAKFGGHYLVRGGATVPLEGAAPAQRIVVIEFPSLDAAKTFWGSSDYQAIAPLRHAAADGTAFLVEGVAP